MNTDSLHQTAPDGKGRTGEDESRACKMDRLFNPIAIGERCVFDAEGGWDYEKATAMKRLTLGETYTVAEVEIHSAHTRVWLVGKGDGYRDWFNSMLFRPLDRAASHHLPSPQPSAESINKELLEALRELHEAHCAMYPPAEAGMEAQTAWAERRAAAHDKAIAAIAKALGGAA